MSGILEEKLKNCPAHLKQEVEKKITTAITKMVFSLDFQDPEKLNLTLVRETCTIKALLNLVSDIVSKKNVES